MLVLSVLGLPHTPLCSILLFRFLPHLGLSLKSPLYQSPPPYLPWLSSFFLSYVIFGILVLSPFYLSVYLFLSFQRLSYLAFSFLPIFSYLMYLSFIFLFPFFFVSLLIFCTLFLSIFLLSSSSFS